MSQERFEIGDLVRFTAKDREGLSGIVSQPITNLSEGHVLVCHSGHIFGIPVALDDITIADEKCGGFIQLASSLLRLGSHVIEKKIVPIGHK
jgi:hypothetical protein